MNSENHILKIKEHTFVLSSKKVMFWKNKSTLLLSDLHIGKGMNADVNFQILLENVKAAVKEFKPKRIIFLGDLFDAKSTLDKTPIKILLENLKIKTLLVLGNHDKLPPEKYLELGINDVKDQYVEDMFIFTHKPANTDLVNIHGHLHSGVLTKGKKYPCFYKRLNEICLPAFGGTTGKNIYKPTKLNEIFVILDNKVKQL